MGQNVAEEAFVRNGVTYRDNCSGYVEMLTLTQEMSIMHGIPWDDRKGSQRYPVHSQSSMFLLLCQI